MDGPNADETDDCIDQQTMRTARPLAEHLEHLAACIARGVGRVVACQRYVHYADYSATVDELIAWYSILRDAPAMCQNHSEADAPGSPTEVWRRLAFNAGHSYSGEEFVDDLALLFQQLNSMEYADALVHVRLSKHSATDEGTSSSRIVQSPSGQRWGIDVEPAFAIDDGRECTLSTERPRRVYAERLRGLTTSVSVALKRRPIGRSGGHYAELSIWLGELLNERWEGGPERALGMLTALVDLLTIERSEDDLMRALFASLALA
jgi:hypothetical protein